jgi:hypothetical protein
LITAKKNSGQKNKGTEKYVFGLRPPLMPGQRVRHSSVHFSVPSAARTRWVFRGYRPSSDSDEATTPRQIGPGTKYTKLSKQKLSTDYADFHR